MGGESAYWMKELRYAKDHGKKKAEAWSFEGVEKPRSFMVKKWMYERSRKRRLREGQDGRIRGMKHGKNGGAEYLTIVRVI
jgi:hypothetical protein